MKKAIIDGRIFEVCTWELIEKPDVYSMTVKPLNESHALRAAFEAGAEQEACGPSCTFEEWLANEDR